MKKVKPKIPGGDEQETIRELVKANMQGRLDDYFNTMMKLGNFDEPTIAAYEMAVRAFINEISHNGVPKIRRERFNREFKCNLLMMGLTPLPEKYPRLKVE